MSAVRKRLDRALATIARLSVERRQLAKMLASHEAEIERLEAEAALLNDVLGEEESEPAPPAEKSPAKVKKPKAKPFPRNI